MKMLKEKRKWAHNNVTKKQAKKTCESCGKKGLTLGCIKVCRACSMIRKFTGPVRNSMLSQKKEYMRLMENADSLSLTEFIRLQALADYFGRDIEEWVNQSKHLLHLNGIIHSERDSYDRLSEETKKRLDIFCGKVEVPNVLVKESKWYLAKVKRMRSACEAWNEVGF